jgi:hypothetical protein
MYIREQTPDPHMTPCKKAGVKEVNEFRYKTTFTMED